jgi:MEMO1 family protein
MRNPIATKTHYLANPQDLEQQIKGLFSNEMGPGDLPVFKTTMIPLQAVIVPHGSYPIAGPCMAWAYKAIAEQHVEEPLYIILAQPQYSNEDGTTMETFLLPFGEIRPDQEFIKALVEKKNISINNELHEKENCIETQLPLLQFAHGLSRQKVKMVPIFVNSQTNISELIIDIKETLVEQKKTATYIMVSNFTPFGREFNYVPFTEEISKNLFEINNKLFETIKSFDKNAFVNILNEEFIPLSGRIPIEMLFSLIKPEKIILEQTYLSGDINNDYKNMSSYASFVIGKL